MKFEDSISGLIIVGGLVSQSVVILGASDQPDRFAYKAFKLLNQYGHTPLPVHPHLKMIEGVTVFSNLDHVKKPVDTLTMYVNSSTSSQLKKQIIELNPHRIIFNPGSENPELEIDLKNAGIEVINDCTLIMLNAKRF